MGIFLWGGITFTGGQAFRLFTQNGNLNDAKADELIDNNLTFGWYESVNQNAPFKGKWVAILSFKITYPNYAAQVCFPLEGSLPIYHRYKNNGTWGSWTAYSAS